MIGHLQDNIPHERGIGLESSLRWLEIEEAPDAASEGRREQHPRWRLPSNSSTWFGRVGVTYYLPIRTCSSRIFHHSFRKTGLTPRTTALPNYRVSRTEILFVRMCVRCTWFQAEPRGQLHTREASAR